MAVTYAVFVEALHDGGIDYTPTSAVTAGDVIVQGSLVGVAKSDIAANTKGALHVAGVFDFPKSTAGGSGQAAGTQYYWDATNHVATTTSAGNQALGKNVLACADADATVRIRLHQ